MRIHSGEFIKRHVSDLVPAADTTDDDRLLKLVGPEQRTYLGNRVRGSFVTLSIAEA